MCKMEKTTWKFTLSVRLTVEMANLSRRDEKRETSTL